MRCFIYNTLKKNVPRLAAQEREHVGKSSYCVVFHLHVFKNLPTLLAAPQVNLYCKPERRDEFLETITANKRGTDSAEKNALQYTWGEVGV